MNFLIKHSNPTDISFIFLSSSYERRRTWLAEMSCFLVNDSPSVCYRTCSDDESRCENSFTCISSSSMSVCFGDEIASIQRMFSLHKRCTGVAQEVAEEEQRQKRLFWVTISPRGASATCSPPRRWKGFIDALMRRRLKLPRHSFWFLFRLYRLFVFSFVYSISYYFSIDFFLLSFSIPIFHSYRLFTFLS